VSLFRQRLPWSNPQKDDLKLLIDSLTVAEGVSFNDNKILSDIFILPIAAEDNSVMGLLLDKSNQVVNAEIGFKYRNFLLQTYYSILTNGDVHLDDVFCEDRLYLPLIDTKLVTNLYITSGGGLCDDSPFTILGVRRGDLVLPLVMAFAVEGEIVAQGFSRGRSGEICIYKYNTTMEKIGLVQWYSKFISLEVKPQKEEAQSNPSLIKPSAIPVKAKKTPPLKSCKSGNIEWTDPKSIVAYLNQYMVGQTEAKRIVAVGFSNFMVRKTTGSEDINKSNILLIGKSGVGKTMMIELLAKKAGLPFARTSLTGKSTEGYVGQNLSSVLAEMRLKTQGDAPYGIVFLDEIDKLAHFNFSEGGFSAEMQNELIGWLEEANVNTYRNKGHGGETPLVINTKNLLFVTAGAFSTPSLGLGLEEIIRKRLSKGQRTIGFGAGKSDALEIDGFLQQVRPEDLIAYGLRPELLGRLPYIGVLHDLSMKDKVDILQKEECSPLMKFQSLLALRGYDVEFEDTALEVIVSLCPPEIGARAMSAVCNNLFTEIQFDPALFVLKDKLIRITPEIVHRLVTLYKTQTLKRTADFPAGAVEEASS
jgi:ATP-dependent Clp protease ATP-binding subunit ClpX